VLGVTQIIAWGALFYPAVLTLPLVAADNDWSVTFAMGGFSLALFVAGLVSPLVGRVIDRHGGHRVMPAGSLLGAIGLVGLTQADQPLAYLAVWMLLGIAIAASLYAFCIRHSRPHLRRSGTTADHRADIGGRLRVNRELAIDACADRERWLAWGLSGPRRAACVCCRAAACIRLAAASCRARYASG